jgi:hypothetical protein
MSDLPNNQDDESINKKATEEFKVIVTVILVILLIFLGFFIYNLIKCYLPKWRRQKQQLTDEEAGNGRRIEIEEM